MLQNSLGPDTMSPLDFINTMALVGAMNSSDIKTVMCTTT